MRVSTIAGTFPRPTERAATHDGGANVCAEESGARRVRSKNRRLVAKAGERIAELERMHHPAARIGRMGEDGDAQRLLHANVLRTRAQPISGSRAKSQIVSHGSAVADATRGDPR